MEAELVGAAAVPVGMAVAAIGAAEFGFRPSATVIRAIPPMNTAAADTIRTASGLAAVAAAYGAEVARAGMEAEPVGTAAVAVGMAEAVADISVAADVVGKR
jgi:hypothetical protein